MPELSYIIGMISTNMDEKMGSKVADLAKYGRYISSDYFGHKILTI